MRYIEVERIDETYNRTEYEQYCFPDNVTDDDIACDDTLIEAFENFMDIKTVSEVKADGYDVDDYIDNCGWWFYEIDEEEFYDSREE